MMTRAQFRTVRTMLGLTTEQMGNALGFKPATIMAMERGGSFSKPGERYTNYGKREMDHIVTFACGWMLFNGGPFVPWPREEDPKYYQSFRAFHQLSAESMGALMSIHPRRQADWIAGIRPIPNRVIMALCWMRLFGTKNPFIYDKDDEEPHVLPMILPRQFGTLDRHGRGEIIEGEVSGEE